MKVQPASSPSMSNQNTPQLPVEVLLFIAQFLYSSDRGQKDSYLLRQKDMYSFCLVGRAWYSAGIELLYRSPQLARGNKFSQFLATVTPKSGSRQQKVDLGSLVRELLLHALVHHSSPSQTSRLLKATSSNLLRFKAPRVSFAINSLAALSRCQNLRFLDLSLVMGSSMSFPKLKKAVSGISSLEYLSLPTSMELTHTDETVQWPSSLTEMEIGGRIDEALMWSFYWPPHLETLTIDHCILAEGFDTIGTVLSNKQLRQGLRRLIIGQNNESIWDTERQSLGGYYLLIMEKLFYLKIPAHIAAYLFGFVGVYPPPVSGVRAMKITSARHGQDLDLMDDRFPYAISEGLQSHFANIWSLVVSPSVGGLLKERQHDIDDEIWLHLPDDDLNLASCNLHGIDLVDFELKHVLGLSVGDGDN